MRRGVGSKTAPHQPAQPRCANYWAPLTRKRHQQEHRLQRPPERSDPTQHAQGRTDDCPGPCEETATRRTACPEHSKAGGGRPECGGDNQNAEGSGRQRPRNDPRSNQHDPRSNQHHPRSNQHNLGTPTTRLHQRENNTSRNTECSGRQNTATTERSDPTQHVKGRTGDCLGPIKKQQTNGMSHRGVDLVNINIVCTIFSKLWDVEVLCRCTRKAKITKGQN